MKSDAPISAACGPPIWRRSAIICCGSMRQSRARSFQRRRVRRVSDPLCRKLLRLRRSGLRRFCRRPVARRGRIALAKARSGRNARLSRSAWRRRPPSASKRGFAGAASASNYSRASCAPRTNHGVETIEIHVPGGQSSDAEAGGEVLDTASFRGASDHRPSGRAPRRRRFPCGARRRRTSSISLPRWSTRRCGRCSRAARRGREEPVEASCAISGFQKMPDINGLQFRTVSARSARLIEDRAQICLNIPFCDIRIFLKGYSNASLYSRR